MLSPEDLFVALLLHQGYGYATAESPYWQGWRDCIGALVDLDHGVGGPSEEAAARARAYVSAMLPRESDGVDGDG